MTNYDWRDDMKKKWKGSEKWKGKTGRRKAGTQMKGTLRRWRRDVLSRSSLFDKLLTHF